MSEEIQVPSDPIHDEVKSFMNEPEPVAEEVKAPPPMDLDEIAPAEQQTREDDPGRLSTGEIAMIAMEQALTVYVKLQDPWLINPSPDISSWTNFIIQSAANPNSHDICREIHENEVMQAWHERQQFVPPYSKISLQQKAFYLTFRANVLALLIVWKGH